MNLRKEVENSNIEGALEEESGGLGSTLRLLSTGELNLKPLLGKPLNHF